MRSTHFNPRSREGSDACGKQYDRHESISIHAPAKGATVTPADGWVKGLISIHAPAKGATRISSTNSPKELFQSTLPRRERRRLPFRTGKRRISIHAPAKGATPRAYHVTSISSDFNPRPREGSDAFVNVIALQHIPDFNPRSREGSDGTGCDCRVDGYVISIHAPAKGATMCGCFHPSRES